MDMYIIRSNKYNIKLNTKVCINLCKTCDAWGYKNLKSVNNNFCQILSYAILN